jgi:hypothetical protein
MGAIDWGKNRVPQSKALDTNYHEPPLSITDTRVSIQVGEESEGV